MNTICSANECTNEATPKFYDPVANSAERKGSGEVGYHGFTINLCLDHAWDLAAWRHSSAREAMTELHSEGLLTKHSPGWTYVIRMNNGNVKIGKSKDPAQRFIRLSSKANGNAPVHVLALFEGGTSQELIAHDQWMHLRMKGRMEEFTATPELLQWAAEQGVPEGVDLEPFYEWMAKKHLDPKRNGAAAQLKRLGIEDDIEEDWEF